MGPSLEMRRNATFSFSMNTEAANCIYRAEKRYAQTLIKECIRLDIAIQVSVNTDRTLQVTERLFLGATIETFLTLLMVPICECDAQVKKSTKQQAYENTA